jgi:futalosine hydrolase
MQDSSNATGLPPPWLLVVAAPAEAKAVAQGLGTAAPPDEPWRAIEGCEGLDLMMTGIGKANAAAGVAIALGSRTYGAVLNLGIAGALPVATPLALGESIAATRSIYADEGLELPDGSFVGCASMGFPLGPFDDWGVRASSQLLDRLAALTDTTAPVATVSTCSGTDALARKVVARTWAVAEAMEGAAAGQVAACMGVPFLEMRVISNTTGDRERQAWAIGGALQKLSILARGVRDALDAP